MPKGIVANLFRVNLENEILTLVEDKRSKYPSLKKLRELTKNYIYADGEHVYGFGKDLSDLKKIGFKDVQKNAFEIPKTTCQIILEGFCERLNSLFYKTERYRVRTQAFDIKNPISLSVPEVILLRGCEFRTVYLKDPFENKLVFGVIIDLKFRLECEGKPSSYYEARNVISQKYNTERAREIIREIRVKTGDLTPTGKRNSEASRVRYESILKILTEVGEKLDLPCGNTARLSLEPTSIVIEV